MDLLQIKFDGVKVGDINIPAQTFKVPEDTGPAIEAILVAAYDAGTALGESLEANSTLQGKYDGQEKALKDLQEKYDKLEKGSPEVLESAVKSRLGLEKTAAFFKVDKANEMPDGDLKKAIINSRLDDKQIKALKLDEKDEAYVKARYDILAEEAEKSGTALDQLRALSSTSVPKNDNLEDFTKSGVAGMPEGREKFMETSRQAFKNPPGSTTITVLTKPAAA